MRILLASSEAVPFSKTGGLADVVPALAKALAQAGHHVWLIVPHYPQIPAQQGATCPPVADSGQTFEVPVGSKQVSGRLLWAELPASNVTVLLIDKRDYFDRKSLYNENGADYKDNCERFVFFSRAVMETARRLVLRPDIVHANDWQTGLVPALLEIEYRNLQGFEQTASVFTIHNMAFQGKFWHWDMLLTGLDWKYFNWRQMESFGHLNLLKTGITFADLLTTVSPTYASEIQTAEFGCGLHGVFHGRRDDLFGILNGIDSEVWNPATDPALAENYRIDNVADAKAACKAQLQQRLGLPVRRDIPLLGMISRLTDQKGFDLITESADEIVGRDLQLAFLGTGEERYEQFLRNLADAHPDKVAAVVGFDETLAHQIEAGADITLMPSRYEPCGLNQLYSLRYGTVPIVRAVGGLADSVVDATDENLTAGTATGLQFSEYSSRALWRQVKRAVDMFKDKQTWRQLVRTGMRQDWSWGRSAAEYVKVYERAAAKKGDRSNLPERPAGCSAQIGPVPLFRLS